MKNVIAIVGRPNVGKSTLFNRLTKSRDALVADRPGVTRDRKFGIASHRGREFILVDTAGLGEINPDNESMIEQVENQSRLAIEEADAVLWLVDGREGITHADELLARELRPVGDKLKLVVNKCEGGQGELLSAEFHKLGAGDPVPVSAERGEGIDLLMQQVLDELEFDEPASEVDNDATRVCVIGRPNVGKSTLINRLIGEERLVTFDHPGTTRDSIAIDFERDGHKFTLVDTAGVRRRARVSDFVEKYSVIKSLKSIDESDIVIMVMDAHEAITDQDITLLGSSHDQGKALIIAINKWDGIDSDQRDRIRQQLERKLSFLHAPVMLFISALHGTGVGDLFKRINRMSKMLNLRRSTSELTKLLELAIERHQPPLVRGRRIKLRYAHIGGHNPLRVVIHGNQTRDVPDSYTRYLCGFFQQKLKLEGIPVQIEYKYGDNPYAGRKNTLSKRQVQKRRRLMKHVKQKK